MKRGKDLYKLIAAEALQVPAEDITQSQRVFVKRHCFGLMYSSETEKLSLKKAITKLAKHVRPLIMLQDFGLEADQNDAQTS